MVENRIIMHPQAGSSSDRVPSPDFSSLSPNELERLENVLQKQALVENEQNERLAGLRRTMVHLQRTIYHDHHQRQRTNSSSSTTNTSPVQKHFSSSSDITQCYICFCTIELHTNISPMPPPYLCADCHRPVCRRCGNYTSPEFLLPAYSVNLENQSHTSKWRCRMCIVRREVVRKSGSWNVTEDETSVHSPVRLLQKLAAYRASNNSPTTSSSPSPQNERKQSSILTESSNFFSRLWRPNIQNHPTPTSILVASHDTNSSSSFDHVSEIVPPPSSPLVSLPITPPILSASPGSVRRMSFIRDVSSRRSSSSNVTPTPIHPSPPPLRTQPTTSSTVTDPSFEDMTSDQPFDTASEVRSQSLETNIYSSNPGIADDQDDDPDFLEQSTLTYDERQRRLSFSSKQIFTSNQYALTPPFRLVNQQQSDSLPSPEADIDVSMAMDCFSASMAMTTNVDSAQTTSSTEQTMTGYESVDLPNEEKAPRKSSRSGFRNSDSWARKRALMQRGYDWTTTLDGTSTANDAATMHQQHLLNNTASLSNSALASVTFGAAASAIVTQQKSASSPAQTTVASSNRKSDSSRDGSGLQRRRSSRRLPPIPAGEPARAILSNNNGSDILEDELIETTSNTGNADRPYPLRENSLTRVSNRSKSIDSDSSIKIRSNHSHHPKLLHTLQSQNAKSIDVANLSRQKSFLTVNNCLLPQRSLDYPCIVRKAPDLSDIVRRRMLYSKISKQQQQDDKFSSSLERDHVPKVPRKIIIRQDNSIEIALSKPPKLRRQTLSEDYYYGCNDNEFSSITQTSSGSSTLGLPLQASGSGGAAGDRRKTIETCENIYLHAEESSKLRARTPPANPHRILLHRDKNDTSIRTNGLGMRIVGGQECEDGSLGCFVTNILLGGPADVQGNIEVGDQILEFNGHSLIESTYEEVRILQDLCGDIVQLVVQHNNIRLQINNGQTLSSMEVSRHFETVPRLSSSLTRKRRNLPPLPPSLSSTFPKQIKRELYETVETLEVPNVKELKPILINRGRLLAQIWHDIEDMKLALTVIQASNLPLRPNGDQPYTFITGKMIFEDRGFDMFETKIIHSSNPVYNETFVFHEVDTVDVLHLEILLWDRKQAHIAHGSNPHNNNSITATNINDDQDEFLGMIQLPLLEANLEDEPRWYELRDRQTRKPSTSSVTFKSSSNDSGESFRKMPPTLLAARRSDRTPSSELLMRALSRTSTRREVTSESSNSRKNSAATLQTNPYTASRNSHQRSSLGNAVTPAMGMASNNDDDDENDGSSHEKSTVRMIGAQSVKLKRRISKGILKLFDARPRRLSETPTTNKSALNVTNMDSEDEGDAPVGVTFDGETTVINKSPRHSIISVNQDDPQGIRPIPLQQMPIGQLMLPYLPSSRHSSISGSRKSSAASHCDSEDDIDRYFTPSDEQETAESNNVQVHTVGPGQVTPRNYENMINDNIDMGRIQLGLIVTKGLLEIDIICAHGLERVIDDTGAVSSEFPAPDTYVKTYLRTGTRRVQKRKTFIVKASHNPEFHSKLKYNACNVMGRRLQVTVWQRARKFEKNQCIGEAFIQLDNLTLTQHTVAWYKLFREKLVESEFYDSS